MLAYHSHKSFCYKIQYELLSSFKNSLALILILSTLVEGIHIVNDRGGWDDGDSTGTLLWLPSTTKITINIWQGCKGGGLVVDVAWRWHPMCQGEQGAMNNVLLHGVMINDAGGWGGGNCNSARWLSRGHYWLQQGRQWCQQQQMMIFAVVGGGGVAGCGWGHDRQTPCALLKWRQRWRRRQQQWHRKDNTKAAVRQLSLIFRTVFFQTWHLNF